MYLLKSLKEKTLHIVSNDNVCCDPSKIKKNDEVTFLVNSKTMNGIIIMISGKHKCLIIFRTICSLSLFRRESRF